MEEQKKPIATLVTGGSNGIGRAIVEALAAAKQAVISISLEPEDTGLQADQYQCDLSDRTATEQVLKEITERFDVLGLVNNVGTDGGEQDNLDVDLLERLVQVNLRSAVLCTKAVLPAMQTHKRGRIVSISSRTVLGKSGFGLYGATKAGLIALSRSLAIEHAQCGITCNVVSAGPVDTDLGRGGATDVRGLQDLANTVPLGRVGDPKDVANAVMFFLDEQSGWITGQNLFVCGGLSVGVRDS
ncbi:SDR family oxidoreductase [uncultured Roseibium sp.]|uniref:SDR family NAD(P)-dependent oxidoreductase n=1 Tax=uncultured Roseibium sp. TaxID=1936171 RepID=UPI0026146B4C|nr:SDR family oxidoreductase [uncultured Roseibium sp.]